ncbi:hypothetical protein FOA43_001622 [Brettanomyces nanus]|uniref:Replication factor C subunit 1 n=1 Tax=Eeniella nana TaxID=13502 RepID=A0A875RYR3_EENNA|nr:uncharacterized protein FOA43_001622 [Brettanomyces nanus]QPG74296.1 hypothetical protein FOA43_001622 [Brettanomyces nanus]
MPRLDAFFGANAVQRNKIKRSAGSSKDQGCVKRQKKNVSDSTKSSYFGAKSGKAEIIDLDSGDDDEDEIEKEKPMAIKKAIAISPKKGKAKKIIKAAAKTSKPSKSPKSSLAATGLKTAEDILSTIPDADESYLKVDPEAANMNYFQLKARQKDITPVEGEHKEIPKARSNCLNGLTIVFTGVLPFIGREECERLASQYGAKVTKSISGRTGVVVIGRDAGPKKVTLIKQKHIKCIDEDGFIQLLAKMPENGGSGEAAQKELAKKEREISKAIEEAEQEEKEEKSHRRSQKSNQDKVTRGPESQLWTVRYAPTDLRQICGNKGNVEMLYNWLDHWFETQHEGKYSRGAGIDNYRSVLISGPPGTGKTTAANLVAHKVGYDIIEKNASDFRSKKILNQELKVCLDNTSVAGFFKQSTENEAKVRRFVLVMDEVDGMSSGDNGGVAQLAQFCRVTKTPLILICNDKSLPKMRAFDRVCYDMTWRRPTAREMRSRLMTIAHREGLKLDPNVIDELVSSTHNDIRQIINVMSTVARTQKTLNFQDASQIDKSWKKEVALKPFDVVGRLLSSGSYGDRAMYNINEKINLYFSDMDMIPLMMHENYRSTQPAELFNHPPGKQNLVHLKLLAEASNSISESDLINKLIRGGDQQWSLLPFYGVASTIIPGSKICGRVTSRVMFTSWLGQNSKSMKYKRVVQQLQYHSSTKTHTNNQELRLSYLPYLKEMLTTPLIEKGADGIGETLQLLDQYYLTREDWDSIMEMGVGRQGKMDQKLKKIPSRVKTQFTRRYNSYVHPTIVYRTGQIKVGKVRKMKYDDTGDGGDDDDDDDDDNDDDDNDDTDSDMQDINKNSLIKAVNKKPKAKRTR